MLRPDGGTACAPLGAAFPQFSPDGAFILYDVHRVGHYGVRIVPVTGGKSVLLVDGAAGGTLSPDGSTLAVACDGNRFGIGICIATADGTNLRELVSGHSVKPKWSPDGMRIAYLEYNPDGGIFVVESPPARPPSWPRGLRTSGSTTTRSLSSTSAPDKPLDTNTSFLGRQ